MGGGVDGHKDVGFQILFHLFLCTGSHDLQHVFRTHAYVADVVTGVFQKAVETMGRLNDMRTGFIISFAKFSPKAGKKEHKTY